MEYGSKEYNGILDRFKKGRNWLNDITIDIVGGENELPALTLLRAYEEEPSVENTMGHAAQFVLNKEIRFSRNGKIIHSMIYNGGDLSEDFAKAPYLLDPLLKLAYGLMLKKLTPASEDSETED